MPTDEMYLSVLLAAGVVWLGSAALIVANRILYDYREQRLREIAVALTSDVIGALPPSHRADVLEKILSRKSRTSVYRLIANPSLPPWVRVACVSYSVDRWGLSRIMRDAEVRRRFGKWRRVSALFALGILRPPKLHEILTRAVFDPDADIAGAGVAVLQDLGDRRAAEILISALRTSAHSSSRIATQLDQFPVAIDDLLRPLLNDTRPHVRYWATSLLARYAGTPGLSAEIAGLESDSHAPVRKAVLDTLGTLEEHVAIAVALRLLDDPVAYVRSTAIRSLAQHEMQHWSESSKSLLATRISTSLSDMSWGVRLAAKEALVALGPTVWREVAPHLDSPDAFARNGAAEVMQNIGMLDATMDALGRGAPPSGELISALARTLREGGPTMIDAALARARPEFVPELENLLAPMGFLTIRT